MPLVRLRVGGALSLLRDSLFHATNTNIRVIDLPFVNNSTWTRTALGINKEDQMLSNEYYVLYFGTCGIASRKSHPITDACYLAFTKSHSQKNPAY